MSAQPKASSVWRRSLTHQPVPVDALMRAREVARRERVAIDPQHGEESRISLAHNGLLEIVQAVS